VTLHVERGGTGRDLVLLHGWALHSGVWNEAMPALHQRFRVHAVDLPGHGLSRGACPGTLDAAACEIADATPAGAVLCGWSLGGLVAQRIARLAPQRIRGLVLVGSTPCFMAREGWSHGMAPGTLEEFSRGLREDRDATLTRFVQLNAIRGADGRAAARAFTERLFERGQPSQAALQRTLGWLRDTDLRGDAPHLGTPTLVIHGGRDALAPVEAGRWLARSIPGARAVELDDAAHLPFFTHRDAFTRALESFVA
jgi:pimeloyl-[acyl-carrier protein] methyl ester esterase